VQHLLRKSPEHLDSAVRANGELAEFLLDLVGFPVQIDLSSASRNVLTLFSDRSIITVPEISVSAAVRSGPVGVIICPHIPTDDGELRRCCGVTGSNSRVRRRGRHPAVWPARGPSPSGAVAQSDSGCPTVRRKRSGLSSLSLREKTSRFTGDRVRSALCGASCARRG